MEEKTRNLNAELEKTKAHLLMLYEISSAMRKTLKLDEILYIILTCVTSHEGLGFNRAMLFLINERRKNLEGRMGIGPHTGEQADKIWKKIEKNKMSLEDLIAGYQAFRKLKDNRLNNLVRNIHIPLKENAGILALTALEGMAFEITTELAKKRLQDQFTRMLGSDLFVTVPLRAKEKILGVIMADNIFTKRPISKDDVMLLTMLADQAGLAIENSRAYEKKLNEARTDSLTGLINHGRFQYLLAREIKRAKKYHHPLSLIMLDIDYFKPYNDKYGHPAGDKVLSMLAKLIKKSSRKSDIPARYGGEEFAIILPHTTSENAYLSAERLRKKVEELPVKGESILPTGKLTISLGVSSMSGNTAKSGLILQADAALYEAKRHGRNRSLVYHPSLQKIVRRSRSIAA